MSSHYKRGKFTNRARAVYRWGSKLPALKFSGRFAKTLIVRGIGYRAFALSNDLLNKKIFSSAFVESLRPIYSSIQIDESKELSEVGNFEFSQSRYLMVRAGHTRDLILPMHSQVRCVTKKKDRKLVIISEDKILAGNLARFVHLYRAPSVYTGRGVRMKHLKPLRKAGKKDKQRGKAF